MNVKLSKKAVNTGVLNVWSFPGQCTRKNIFMNTMSICRVAGCAFLLFGLMIVSSCSEENNDAAVKSTSPGVPASQLPKGKANYGGAVDHVDCDGIGGWFWNSEDPTENIRVEIFVDNKLLNTVPANALRPDLIPMGGTGNYAFRASLPDNLKDGKPHTVTAKVAGIDRTILVWDQIKPTFVCK